METSQLFGQCFRAEYLVMLQKRQKWQFKMRNVRVGNVMLILDENLPRH